MDGPLFVTDYRQLMGDKFDRLPVEMIELEMESILAEEHGFVGVRVFIDRESGSISCSQDVPTGIYGTVLAVAAKRAIVKFVREQEDRDGG